MIIIITCCEIVFQPLAYLNFKSTDRICSLVGPCLGNANTSHIMGSPLAERHEVPVSLFFAVQRYSYHSAMFVSLFATILSAETFIYNFVLLSKGNILTYKYVSKTTWYLEWDITCNSIPWKLGK